MTNEDVMEICQFNGLAIAQDKDNPACYEVQIRDEVGNIVMRGDFEVTVTLKDTIKEITSEWEDYMDEDDYAGSLIGAIYRDIYDEITAEERREMEA